MAVLLSLGCWQVKRLAWKEDLLATIDARMKSAPEALPPAIDDPAAWEYRPVTLSGRFIQGHEFLLKPRVKDGRTGYHLVMPFKADNGAVVFIDRGWADDAGMKAFPRPDGHLALGGIVTLPHKNYFTPENNPARNDWYWADVRALGDAAGIKGISPVLVSADMVRPDIPNNHRQYAVFWFSMAVIFFIVFILSCREKREGKT